MDLPRELVAHVVSFLPYAALPAFRTACGLARELVDAASNGWVMKVEEGEALQTSRLLHRLTSLLYVWFEGWSWEGEQEANFLAVILANLPVFARLQEVRFPGSRSLPLRCLRGLLAALPAVTLLSLPPLPPPTPPDSPAFASALSAIAAATSLTELSLDGWALTDAAAATLAGGLPRLRRAALGNTGALTRRGYESLARLTGLVSLMACGARGGNQTLAPLACLTGLVGLRIELAPGFPDADTGPLAGLPGLRTLGWWHADPQPPACLSPGSLCAGIRELSLCCSVDARALGVLQGCARLCMMQVHSIELATMFTNAASSAAATSEGGSASLHATAASRIGRRLGFSSRLAPPPSRPAIPVLPSVRTLIVNELHLPIRGIFEPLNPSPLLDDPEPPLHEQPAAAAVAATAAAEGAGGAAAAGRGRGGGGGAADGAASLSVLFPSLENFLTFGVQGRGLAALARCERLRRLVLNCPNLQSQALDWLPPLPSLAGLQLEGCANLSAAAAAALRDAPLPSLEVLMLLDTEPVDDDFLAAALAAPPAAPAGSAASSPAAEAARGAGADGATAAGKGSGGGGAGALRSLRSVVLSGLPEVTDEGLQHLAALSGSLTSLELRCLPRPTPAGISALAARLPRLSHLGVTSCPGLDKEACRALAAALAAAERDVSVEHDATALAAASLADEFVDPEEPEGTGHTVRRR